MCHYVTAVIGGSIDLSRLNAIAEKHGRLFSPVDNAWVKPYLEKGEAYFSTLPRRAMCDCGTALGWLPRELARAPKPLDRDAEARRLRRKGWGEGKVARWLESKERDLQGWKAPATSVVANDKQNETWLSLAQELLSQPAVTSFGLMVHWYKSGLENSIPMKGRMEVALNREALASMEDCRLYVYRQ